MRSPSYYADKPDTIDVLEENIHCVIMITCDHKYFIFEQPAAITMVDGGIGLCGNNTVHLLFIHSDIAFVTTS